MYEIVNGILYNTGIDAAYSDIVNDFQSDTSMGGYEINNGILYNTDIDQTYNELVSEMPADGFEMHNGILYNTSIDTAYNELMSDLVPAIQEMEKVNAENRAKGIYPPLYNGFMTDPLSDSIWQASMDNMDFLSENSGIDVSFTAPVTDTAADLADDVEFNRKMAESYGNDGMTGMEKVYEDRMKDAADKLADGEFTEE